MSEIARAEVVVIAGVILAIAAIGIPALLSSRRASNERTSAAALKMVAAAEADFRTNDRDGNGVNDFWTGDVKGLHTMTAAGAANPLQLISRTIAAADSDGTFHPAGGENLPLSQFAAPAPSIGYWYLALETDRSASGPERTYRQDTGGKPAMGSVHHVSKFGFAAFPDSSSVGKYLFIVNEDNTIFRHAPRETVVRTGKDIPPGRNGLRDFYRHWPDDKGIRKVSLLCCGECHCPECGYAGEHDP